MLDTENSELGSVAVVDDRRGHPLLALDLRNGDFVRGDYDDDGAGLFRVPVHVQLGAGLELHRDDEAADLWLVGRSSNGFHAPRLGERSPRAWYESNNLVGLVATLAPGFYGAIDYVVKTSPNGVSSTTHEASASFFLDRNSGLGAVKPTLVATVRPKGGKGLYTQVGIGPELKLAGSEDAPSLAIPAHIGVGWGGFYGAGTGTVLYGDGGLAFSHPLRLAGGRWRLRAELLALFQDRTLRRRGRSSSAEADAAAIVPQATLSLSLAL